MTNFQITSEDRTLIAHIARRACETEMEIVFAARPMIDWMMDITACHASNPLKLADLLAFDRANFSHDVFGIAQHLDRETGKLRDCFSPRCSV